MSLEIIGAAINPKIEYFDVIKAPPSIVPNVDYINDTTFPVNNLLNKFFQFRYRFVYDDNEKSVWSAISKVPIPEKSLDNGTNTQGGFQNVINILLQTGDFNVAKIEIAGRVNIDSQWSDFFLVDTLDKKRDRIESNLPYVYTFRNDSVYTAIDLQESNLLFDYVPDRANALELANGNTLVVGGLKDGYNRDTQLDVTLTSILRDSPAEVSTLTATLAGPDGTGIFPEYTISDRNPADSESSRSRNIFVGTVLFSGNPQVGDIITITLNGKSTRDVIGLLGVEGSETYNFSGLSWTVVVKPGWNITDIVTAFKEHVDNKRQDGGWNISIDSGSGLFGSFNVARPRQPFYPMQSEAFSGNMIDGPTPPFTIEQNILYVGAFVYRRPATTGGFEIDPRTWEFWRPTVTIVRGFSFNSADAFPTLKWNGLYRYGLVYYDKNGKTNGVYTNNTLSLRTGNYNTSYDWTPVGTQSILPENESCQIYIGHKPPSWADYYHIVRTKDLSCDFSLMVISPDIKFNSPKSGYWYIDIESINDTKDEISESAVIIKYDSSSFVIGDRVRILQKLNQNGSVNWSNLKHLDLPILAVESHVGKLYIKVKLIQPPVGHIQVNEGDKLVIEIYRPAKVLSDEDLIYYEIGERYGIATDLNGNRYHTGQETVNSIVLSEYNINAPASVQFQQNGFYGDITITLGPEITDLKIGDQITVTGSNNNDKTYVVQNLNLSPAFSQFNITVFGSLNTEFNTSGNIVISRVTRLGINYAYINLINDGDYYYRARAMVNNTNGTTNGVIYVADKNFTDNYLSAVWSQGRPLVVDENAKEEYYPAMLRFSQSYIPGTNINNLSRFYPNNFEDADASFGDILRLKTRENFIRIFQRFKTGMIPIYRQIIIDNAQSSQVALSERLLNKPNYYSGEYGIDKYGSSLVSTDYGDYFVDTINKAIVRVSLDGVTNISDTNDMASWANSHIKESSFGFGCFNYENRNVVMYVGHIEPIQDEVSYNIISNIIAYSEPDKKFESFYGFTDTENMLFANGFILTFKDGMVYIHDSETRNNFYGEQQSSTITTVFNNNMQLKKTYLAIEELSTDIWYGELSTGPLTNQETTFTVSEFQKPIGGLILPNKENKFNTTIKRAENKPGGKFFGESMKGLYATVELNNDSSSHQRLISVSLKYIQSPLTNM